jgi:hypothetical protein
MTCAIQSPPKSVLYFCQAGGAACNFQDRTAATQRVAGDATLEFACEPLARSFYNASKSLCR